MASMNVDKPLDELIKADPTSRRRGRGRGGSAAGGNDARKRSSASARNAAGPKGGAAAANQTRAQRQSVNNANRPPVVIPGRGVGAATGSKIILSNLPLDVTDGQVKELFSTSIGAVKRVAMTYNARGQSTGVCTVEFVRSEDAKRSYEQYNNRLIDGKKPLKVEVVVDLAKVPLQPAAPAGGRGAQASGAQNGGRGGRGAAAGAGAGRNGGAAGAAAQANGAAGASGSRARRGGRTTKPKKTVEDLDAEMEDYAKAGQSDAANAAAPAPAA